MKIVSAVAVACLANVVLQTFGCAPRGPTLERFELSTSEWVALGPVVIDSVTGGRDGAEIRATAVFSRGEDRIMLELELYLDPPARFVRGRHRSRLAGEDIEGPVSSDGVDFLGGQTSNVSVGGAYVLEGSDGAPRYRVRFPATELGGSP